MFLDTFPMFKNGIRLSGFLCVTVACDQSVNSEFLMSISLYFNDFNISIYIDISSCEQIIIHTIMTCVRIESKELILLKFCTKYIRVLVYNLGCLKLADHLRS